jgi:hypothetical protein
MADVKLMGPACAQTTRAPPHLIPCAGASIWLNQKSAPCGSQLPPLFAASLLMNGILGEGRRRNPQSWQSMETKQRRTQ